MTKPNPPGDNALLKKPYLSTTEAGKLLGLHPVTVLRFYDEGKLRGWRTSDAEKARVKLETASVIEFAEKVQGRKLIASRA